MAVAELSLSTSTACISPVGDGRNDLALLPPPSQKKPSIWDAPNAWLQNKSLRKSSSEVVGRFHHIAIDLRGVRGGNGDTAAGYLFALNLIERWRYSGKISLIADKDATRILSTLTGTQLQPNDRILSGQAQVIVSGKIPWRLPPADFYLSLARAAGKSNDANDVLSSQGVPIRLAKDACTVTQTVIGNTENQNSSHPNGSIRIGDTEADIRPPGLADSEAGIYRDPIAAGLRDKPRESVLNFVDEALLDIPDKNLANSLSDIVHGRALIGAAFTFAYGLSHENVSEQFRTYLRGMAEHLSRPENAGHSFVLVTPSRKEKEFYQSLSQHDAEFGGANADRVVLIENESQIPKHALPGKIYVLQIKSVPHTVFNGLLALSSYPPIVSGDCALSGAIALGKPFVMTTVKWNKANVDTLTQHLIKLDPTNATLYRGLFQRMDLSLAETLQEDPNAREAFARLFEAIGDFPETVWERVADMLDYRETRETPAEMVARAIVPDDPSLRISLLLDGINHGQRNAMRHLIEEFRNAPRSFFVALDQRILPEEVLHHVRFKRFLKDLIAAKKWRDGYEKQQFDMLLKGEMPWVTPWSTRLANAFERIARNLKSSIKRWFGFIRTKKAPEASPRGLEFLNVSSDGGLSAAEYR